MEKVRKVIESIIAVVCVGVALVLTGILAYGLWKDEQTIEVVIDPGDEALALLTLMEDLP
jgi:hypothetical protein